MSKNHKKFCTTLNYIDYLLILASLVTVCVFVSAFAPYVSFCALCAITAGIKKYYPIIKKKIKGHEKNVLLTKVS